MSATAAPNLAHDPSSDLYDSDDALPKNSPILAAYRPNLQPSPSPPPLIPYTRVSPPSTSADKRSNRRRRPKVKASQGDAVLVSFLDGGRRPEIAITAGTEALPSDTELEDEDDDFTSEESSVTSQNGAPDRSEDQEGNGLGEGRGDLAVETGRMALDSPQKPAVMGIDLTSLAASALAATSVLGRPDGQSGQPGLREAGGPSPPPLELGVAKPKFHHAPIPAAIQTARDLPRVDDRSKPAPGLSPFSPQSFLYSPSDHGHLAMPSIGDVSAPSSAGLPPPHAPGDLPPIQLNSPRSAGSGHAPLPSIKAQFGDINQLGEHHSGVLRPPLFAHSPPSTLGRTAPLGFQGSPPISPNDTFRRDLPSPSQSLLASPPFYYHPPLSGGAQRPPDYASSTTETPSTADSASTPATSATSVADRMSIDGITTQPVGQYVCTYSGCTAPPFQTQYLLNSHANVHSQARPHYCPVKGCPRSEGGKGFKRKNEMIRHGLVHESPGYVCPFCNEREHRYPRPDNLQRHVRVHHMDKDKDDPLLRDVLAQRPDGPSRGRRRRGNAA